LIEVLWYLPCEIAFFSLDILRKKTFSDFRGGWNMTTAVKTILYTFEHLPDTDKREVASEILRRTIHLDFPSLQDETLIACAEELFLALDREESEHEYSIAK
jgi:hypothetical protein